MQQRTTTFDALRGIAALLVLATHICIAVGGLANILQYSFFSPGIFGVVLFFCISGAVIPAAHQRAGSERVYWIRRLARIVPPYLIGMALAALVRQPSPPVILAHLTMLPDLFGIHPINGVFWTLEIELLFYLLISVGWKGHPLPWLILAFLTGWLAPLGIATIGCGMALRKPGRFTLLLCALVSLGWLTIPSDGSVGVRIAAACGLPVYMLALRYKGAAPRVLRHLGDLSFGIYLLHMPIIWWLSTSSPLVWVGATLIAAAALHLLIERPCMSWAKTVRDTEHHEADQAGGQQQTDQQQRDLTTSPHRLTPHRTNPDRPSSLLY